jgi:hypothetical protein
MKRKKIIPFTVAKVFPCYHPRAGEPTDFKPKILSGEKGHTIRANYELWKKRIDEVNAGEAILSLRQWIEKPYHSKQEEFLQLEKAGIQKIKIVDHGNFWYITIFDGDGTPKVQSDCIDHCDCRHSIGLYCKLVTNDGLSGYDFKFWFKPYDLSEPMALIHLTDMRY